MAAGERTVEDHQEAIRRDVESRLSVSDSLMVMRYLGDRSRIEARLDAIAARGAIPGTRMEGK